jgi:hypothetical protein
MNLLRDVSCRGKSISWMRLARPVYFLGAVEPTNAASHRRVADCRPSAVNFTFLCRVLSRSVICVPNRSSAKIGTNKNYEAP